MANEQYIVNGYSFVSKSEYERAKKEQVNIEKIKATIDINDVPSVLEMYEKLTSKKYFTTQVGLSFLAEMREYLCANGIEDVSYVKVSPAVSMKILEDYKKMKRQLETSEEKVNKLQFRNRQLFVFVVTLIICVVGMIFMIVTSDNLGYINAEEKVLNKYSAWEEDLKQREQAIIQREEELK